MRPAIPGQTAFVIEATPADFEVYSGDDPMTLPLLAVGAVGAIGVATHWCAPDHVQMFDAWDAGDAAAARAHNARQLESYAFETSDAIPNPLPAKAMLRDARPRRSAKHDSRWGRHPRASPTRPARSTTDWWPPVAEPTTQPMTAKLDPTTPVRIVFLGGLGEIGRNCMVIEQGAADDPDRTMMLIDCGLMFPDANMHGIDLILPDFTYLKENANRIQAIVLTHGHEDHIGAIQYLMRDGDGIGDLRDDPLPVYGSALRSGWPRNRIEEAGLMPKIDMRPVQDGEQIDIGSLLIEFIPVTHSVPHAHAIAVHTAQGVVLHSGDFKIDLTPVDERRADLARIGQLAKNEGIRLLMSDSTNAEEPGYAPSETNVGGVLRGLFAQQRGRRIITASFASHIHRIQQIADAAVEEGRKVATLGLSMKKNIRLGLDLGVFRIPESSLIDIEDIGRYDPGDICIISTGSQGEPMSALGLDGPRREPVAEAERPGHRRAVQPRDPRQRGQRQQGDRRSAPAGRERRPLRRDGRPCDRPRPGRRHQDVPVDRQPRVVRADPRRVPPHGRQRQAR